MQERESMSYDVIIVGAGPAGLSAAIRLKQLAQAAERELSVCILEKGAEVGAHILSGAVLEPRALNELFPDWQTRGAPLTTPVTEDQFLWLSAKRAVRLPTPPTMQNHGNYIISLGMFCRWLAEQATNLGVEIYPGFAGSEILFERERVCGIATGDMGVDKNGAPTAQFQRGMALLGKHIILAEGCRGSLTQFIQEKYALRKNADPQTYGLGIKELWQVTPEQHHPGRVIHTIGWPMDNSTYGGSFIYHLKEDCKVAVGFVVGLDYKNPYLSPFEEMQRFKTHSAIAAIFKNGKRIAYGARALNEGGYQSIPELVFPGGLIIGDSAGLLNVAKIKGTHTAMKSGMLAAEAIFNDAPHTYTTALKNSWVYQELYKVRNIRPSFRFGLWAGLCYSALDQYVLRGRAPWTLHHHADHLSLQLAHVAKPINYPKPDGQLTFDRLSSVFLAGVHHEENQPVHLRLAEPQIALDVNYQLYAAPETRYCPAGVYEIVQNSETGAQLQINAANCVHCKTCDIKDPKQNITWVPPEGGGGPNYSEM